VESFSENFPDECLSENWLADIPDARRIIEAWRVDYSQLRPHGALENLSPSAFAQRATWSFNPRGLSGRTVKAKGSGHDSLRFLRYRAAAMGAPPKRNKTMLPGSGVTVISSMAK
jgi:hypothetical protein